MSFNKGIISGKTAVVPALVKKKGILHHIQMYWQLYLMVLPAVTFILLFQYKPMYGVLIAFKNYRIRLGVWGSPWVGFDNFKRLFSSYWFPVIIKNTLTLSIYGLVLGFPVPIILALMVNEVKNLRIRKIYQTVIYAPHFISTVVICGMITMFLSPSTGIINRLIEILGGERIFFMQSSSMFKWIYVLSGIWQSAGWAAIIYFAALAGVDPNLLEAAEIDGASRLQRIIHVNFPVLIPTITILLILRCGQILSIGYEKTFLLQNSTNLMGSEVISTYVYKMGLERMDFSFSTATSVFDSVINSTILILANWISRRVSQNSLW